MVLTTLIRSIAGFVLAIPFLVQTAHAQRTVRVPGGTIFYRVEGSGAPLLLVHGLSTASPIWESAADSLKSRHTLITVDLPGHGNSRNDRHDLDFRLVAADLHRLLDRLKVERLSAIGHSGGGVVVLHMAAQRPARFSRLVVAAAPTKLLEPTRAALRFVSTNEDPAHLSLMRGWHPDGQRQIAEINRYTRYFAEVSASVVDVSKEELKAITAHVLVAHGDRDFLVPLEVAVATFETLSSAELLVLPKADHGFLFASLAPTSGPARELFWRAVEGFLHSPDRE